MGLQDISCDFLIRTVWSGLLGCALYTVYLCIYRLYFHPLASVPGPKLAAVTRFYEAYYNVLWHDGQYLFKTEKLHAIYGGWFRSIYCAIIMLTNLKAQSFASHQTRFQSKTHTFTTRSIILAQVLRRIQRSTAVSGLTIPCSPPGETHDTAQCEPPSTHFFPDEIS